MRILLLLCGLMLTRTPSVRAGVCVRLVGIIQDFSTHQPLSATLFARMPTGRTTLGNSAEGTGQFAVDIACTASVLLIERAGYRPQRLPLNLNTFSATSEVYVVIPMVAVDRQGVDRPYLQTEQKLYVQPASTGTTGQVQHNTFTVADALTGGPLRGQVCFFFTKTSKKTCLDTDATGQCTIDFADKDIVAMEAGAPGYQAYRGNISVERLGGPALRHDVRLLRELILLSVQTGPVPVGGQLRGLLRGERGQKPVLLASVAGKPGVFTAADLLPSRYELQLLDGRQTILHRQPLTILPGLNVQTVALSGVNSTTIAPPITPVAAPVLADNLPPIFFSEGSYELSNAARATLQQVATYLQQHQDVHLRLVGHTDRLGDERLNQYLGEFRAKVVANCLHWQMGVADDRFQIVGFGSRFLIGANDDAESRSRNRRVTLKLIPARPLAESPITSN